MNADVLMVEAVSFIHSEFDHFFGAWGEAKFTKHNAISTSNDKFSGRTNLVQFHAKVAQYFGGNTFTFACEGEQEVFGADVVMWEAALRFFLGAREHPADLHCEGVKPLVTHLHQALDEGCLRES